MLLAPLARAAEPMPTSRTVSVSSSGYGYHDAGDAETEVYAAFLEKNFKAPKNDGPQARNAILVENESVDAWLKNRRAWESYLVQRITGPGRASNDCMRAFLLRPQQVLRFYSFPATKHTLKFVRSDELLKTLAHGWDAFYEAYPGSNGFLSFGVIGWSPDHSEALFTVHSQCGRKCGYRDIVYMQRINGNWEIVIKEPLP